MKKTVWMATIAILVLFAAGFAASDEDSDAGIPGTYEATDGIGRTLVLTLKEDKTGTATIKEEGKTYYCSWEHRDWHHGEVVITFGYSHENPELVFEGGEEHCMDGSQMLDGWLYCDNSATDAKDPTRRLPIKKVK